ncbi:MAG: phytanoyl-CoA dioxygenase family protein [Pseudomonadota bacterium]
MQLHPLNKKFAWEQPTSPCSFISDAQAQAYREVGGFIYSDAFSKDELDSLIAELDPIEAKVNLALADEDSSKATIARADEIVFMPHVVKLSPVARQFAQHPVMQGLCRDLIGDAVRLYWDQLVYKRPETPVDFPWHQDNGYTYVEPQQYLTCWVALTDATIENGCPWIAPGVHQQGTLRHRWSDLGFVCLEADPADAQPMPLKAGSIAVFSSLTPHRTGPNLTEQIRKAYILQYAPDGAVAHPRDSQAELANDETRQFRVV